MKKKALYFSKRDKNVVKCELCPFTCMIQPGKTGICTVRYNKDGELFTSNYSEVTSIALDPIEKKPLYHFFPGEEILSVGTFGCNFKCEFCQNWQISQSKPSSRFISPETLLDTAVREKSFGVAYTYSEPIVWFEYVLESAKLLKDRGLKNVMVTNGFINQKPLLELCKYIDAMNIDLKGYTDIFYERFPHGKLQPVLETIKTAYARGVHIEITNLIIPGLNDDPGDLEELIKFIASVSPEIPLHFSRYFPHYKMKKEPTPEETMLKAKELGDKYLKYVYLGNIWSKTGSETFCPACGEKVISRKGYFVDTEGFKHGNCKYCGAKLNFVVE